SKRYELAKVGRFKVNQKLDVLAHLEGKVMAQNVIDKETGEVIVKEGTEIDKDVLSILDQNRHNFSQPLPGVLRENIEFDFQVQKDILDANPYLDWLGDDEKLLHIKYQRYWSAEAYANEYLKQQGHDQKSFVEAEGNDAYETMIQSIEETLSKDELYFELAQVEILEVEHNTKEDKNIKVRVIGNDSTETAENLVPSDIVASMGYYLN
ncbi:hypothetical protein, partial [Methanocalculus natronophilus]|uniref:hypothetical protein n=1 Tax=Methanocalculus natronophilus TaxID=1262400 RepID=UPI0031B61E10